MKGFRKIYGVNWLNTNTRVIIYANNNTKDVAKTDGPLPMHWFKVKDILLRR